MRFLLFCFFFILFYFFFYFFRYCQGNFVNPDLPPETREAPPGPVGLSVVARVLAPLVINHSTQIFLEEAGKKITFNVKF